MSDPTDTPGTAAAPTVKQNPGFEILYWIGCAGSYDRRAQRVARAVVKLLNAAGVPNLFELQFAHNGYRSAERHASQPHTAVPLPAIGPLAVHAWWRPIQARLLEAWRGGVAEGSGWAIRSLTTESTYYPLVDAAGRPVRRTYRLVLTPAGLSAS